MFPQPAPYWSDTPSGGPAVVCLGDGIPDVLGERLAGRARLVPADDSSLPRLLPGADVLFAWDFNSDAVRAAWPRDPAAAPAWVHAASAGVDRLLFPALIAANPLVTNSRGVFEQPIAEYVAGVVLAFAKDFPGNWARQREHRWEHRETRRVAGTEAVVVGAGPIGRAIGRTLAGLGVRVVLVGRTAREDDAEFGRIRPSGALKSLLPSADWVVAAAPLTEATRGMFDASAFSAMREGAVFVNVGRGPLVVEADLLAAVRGGGLGGAALDVFEEEPLPPDSPLWDAPGVLVSAHMSGDAVGWKEALVDLFVAEFGRWTEGKPLRNVVDPALGYVPVTP